MLYLRKPVFTAFRLVEYLQYLYSVLSQVQPALSLCFLENWFLLPSGELQACSTCTLRITTSSWFIQYLRKPVFTAFRWVASLQYLYTHNYNQFLIYTVPKKTGFHYFQVSCILALPLHLQLQSALSACMRHQRKPVFIA